jgi:hypothetical protein
MTFVRAISNLREMFPYHSQHTIETVLRDHHGALDSAITHLLRLPADVPEPMQTPRTQAGRHGSTSEQRVRGRLRFFLKGGDSSGRYFAF